ncbi:GPO family capsid scaffolding protein [Pseudomonas sp. V104_10]|uniref:GPO family capsid scaffolding protein n=1 Tax=Pseudomonas sp. V104_10 TaxID=3044231 RepID=UPI00249F01A2|nr:GPO family capsid scaffolding protein [Pseudomonas sp. V104_10]MDI3371021.1 GPO family capsid scaffolding protein [Pseudomonas sp. V104_10]
MPRSLVSYWKRVAKSGPTVDGREILPQELRDIAETYNPSEYTAVIWCEHERWYGSHGTVFSVRLVEQAEDLKEGQVALEAQLKPNDRLLWLNDQGEKLFSSIEITPNFANTGKAYLTGLAVTDSPASLGTQELYFSKRTSRAAYYSVPLELGAFQDDKGGQSEEGKLLRMFTNLFKRFATEEPAGEAADDTPTESKPPMDEATAKAIQALIEQQMIVTAGLQAIVDGFAEEEPEPEQEPIDDVQAAVDAIVSTAEEEKQLSKRGGNKSLQASLAKLEKQFNQLANTSQTRQVPRTTGANVEKKRVF